jgi:hypothetical protein
MNDRNERVTLIRAEAIRFRKEIEKSDPDVLRLIFFGRFPRGCCGDASNLLATYLKEKGLGDFGYVLAYRGSAEEGTHRQHAWLEQDDLIVDITADQFEDAEQGVIVSVDSAWHRFFTKLDNHRTLAGCGGYDSETVERLCNAYREIRRHLPESIEVNLGIE